MSDVRVDGTLDSLRHGHLLSLCPSEIVVTQHQHQLLLLAETVAKRHVGSGNEGDRGERFVQTGVAEDGGERRVRTSGTSTPGFLCGGWVIILRITVVVD